MQENDLEESGRIQKSRIFWKVLEVSGSFRKDVTRRFRKKWVSIYRSGRYSS